MNPELQARLAQALERPHRLGMIGGILEEQLAHCASFSRVLAEVLEASPDDPATTATTDGAGPAYDLGTGGGVPGLALAAVYPEFAWTLVEIRTARATELERAALRLGLDCVIHTAPAQELGHRREHRERARIVTARSFGPPSMTAECAAGLLSDGGQLIVSEPPDTHSADRWPTTGLRALGLGSPRMLVNDGHHFAVIQKEAPTPASAPRTPPRADRGWLG